MIDKQLLHKNKRWRKESGEHMIMRDFGLTAEEAEPAIWVMIDCRQIDLTYLMRAWPDVERDWPNGAQTGERLADLLHAQIDIARYGKVKGTRTRH